MAPFDLMRADLSGTEDRIDSSLSLRAMLARREHLRFVSNPRSVNYRVVDRDDPERGALDWDDAEVAA